MTEPLALVLYERLMPGSSLVTTALSSLVHKFTAG